jgi:zinc protease
VKSRALLALALLTSCVTTRQLDDQRSPDPRDDLPELSAEQHKATTTVLDVSARDPIVNVRVMFHAGSADDPAGKEGLAALAAKLMRQATEKLSAAELADAMFPWAAELDVQVDKDTIVFLGRVHQDHANKWADVLIDIIMHPRLGAKDFARIRDEHKAYLESTLRTGNDEALQREALELAWYDREHPYGHTPMGTVNGLAVITLDDVRTFITAHLVRDRAVLGVSGGASPELVEELTGALARLPLSSSQRTVPATPAGPSANHALFIDKPSAGSAISVGFVLAELSRAHPDYAAMKLAETWFGEHRNLIGHLFNSMREKRGLNYGDYAYVEHFAQEGWSSYEKLNIPRRTQYFSMWIRPVEHKNRLFALRQTLWELDKLVAHGIPDDASFQRVQSFVQGYWRAKEQEPMRALGYRMDQVQFDRNDLRERVSKLTRDEVNAAIKRHLRADRLSIVVVTENAAALVRDIAQGRPSPLAYAGKVAAPQAEEDKVIEAFDLGLGDRMRIIASTELFEQ